LADRPRLAEESDGVSDTVIYMNASSIENNQATLEVKVKSVPKPHHFIWKQASDGAVLNVSNYQPLKKSNVRFIFHFSQKIIFLNRIFLLK
jgi:hypothetical protein